MRNSEEIKKDIERIESQIFMEKMADFMDWSTYFYLEHQLEELKKELLEVQDGR